MKLAYLNSAGDIPARLHAWAKRLVDDLNRGEQLPQYTDDTAAAASNLPLGSEYFDDFGFRKRSGGDVLGQYTDDTAAAADGVAMGAEYFDDTGIRRRRIA